MYRESFIGQFCATIRHCIVRIIAVQFPVPGILAGKKKPWGKPQGQWRITLLAERAITADVFPPSLTVDIRDPTYYNSLDSIKFLGVTEFQQL